MEMCYEGALVMPSNYAVMSEDEMTYVEGGWCIENKWWGFNIYLTHKERQLFTAGQKIAGLWVGLATYGTAEKFIKLFAGIIARYDDGYGVKIRMTGPLKFNAMCTGISSLSKNQEKTIASKNKII